MKTFAELTILDKIYCLNKRGTLLQEEDQYGNIYHPSFLHIHTIKKIECDEDNIEFDRSSSYRYSYLTISPEDKNKSKVENEDKVYYSDENVYREDLKYFILERMKESEQKAIKAKKDSDEFIMNLRENFYEILNP
jgi:hypothetical protein